MLQAKAAKAAADPKAFLAEKEDEYTKTFANPYQAALYGFRNLFILLNFKDDIGYFCIKLKINSGIL